MLNFFFFFFLSLKNRGNLHRQTNPTWKEAARRPLCGGRKEKPVSGGSKGWFLGEKGGMEGPTRNLGLFSFLPPKQGGDEGDRTPRATSINGKWYLQIRSFQSSSDMQATL